MKIDEANPDIIETSVMINTIIRAIKDYCIVHDKPCDVHDLFFRLAFLQEDDLKDIYDKVIKQTR